MSFSFNPDLCRNESEVESKLIVSYLLPKLGYSLEHWHQEVTLGNSRLRSETAAIYGMSIIRSIIN